VWRPGVFEGPGQREASASSGSAPRTFSLLSPCVARRARRSQHALSWRLVPGTAAARYGLLGAAGVQLSAFAWRQRPLSGGDFSGAQASPLHSHDFADGCGGRPRRAASRARHQNGARPITGPASWFAARATAWQADALWRPVEPSLVWWWPSPPLLRGAYTDGGVAAASLDWRLGSFGRSPPTVSTIDPPASAAGAPGRLPAREQQAVGPFRRGSRGEMEGRCREGGGTSVASIGAARATSEFYGHPSPSG